MADHTVSLPPAEEWVARALSGYVRRPRKARQIAMALHHVLFDSGQDEVPIPVRDIARAAGASPSSVALAIERLRGLGLLQLTGGGEWRALPGGRPGQRMPHRYRANWPPGEIAPRNPIPRPDFGISPATPPG